MHTAYKRASLLIFVPHSRLSSRQLMCTIRTPYTLLADVIPATRGL